MHRSGGHCDSQLRERRSTQRNLCCAEAEASALSKDDGKAATASHPFFEEEKKQRNKHFVNAIVHPVKVVKLNNFCGKSAYILGADKAHIVSASERVHGDRFIQGIEFVEKEIGKKRVRTNVEAKRVLASFLSANVF